MNSAHNAMGTLLRSKWCSPTQCQSHAKKNPFTFKTMRKCSCSSCPVPKTVSKQKLEIQLLVSHLLSFWSCCRWCSFSWFLTYFAHTSALSCTRLVCLPVGLNGSIYPMTSFTDWTVFREGTPPDCTIFLFPPLFLGESIIMRSKVLTVLQCTRIPKGKSFPMQGPWRLPTIESKLKSRFCVALLAIPVKLRFYFLKLKRRGGGKKSHQIFLRVEWRKKNQLTGKHSRSSTIHVQCSITVNDNQEEVRHSKTKTDHNEQPNKSSFLSLSTQFGLNLDLICQTLL